MSRKSALAMICDDTQGRHQSFHPRHGWLKRAYDEIHQPDTIEHPEATGLWQLFYSPDATSRLGVGKNMVQSIRFWSTATRLLCEVPDPANGRRTLAVPTQTGRALLADDDGYDPFMERPGTWWAVHWLLHAPPRELDSGEPVKSQVPSWWAILNLFGGAEFTVDDMTDWLVAILADELGSDPSRTSVKRDVQTFVHAYSREVDSRAKADDLIDSPLRQLGLVEASYGDSGTYRISTGPKHNLPPHIATFAVFDLLDRHCTDPQLNARPEFVEHVAAISGSPASVFAITDATLATLLRSAAAETPDLLIVTADPAQGLHEVRPGAGHSYRSAADAALARYYGHGDPRPMTDQADPDVLALTGRAPA